MWVWADRGSHPGRADDHAARARFKDTVLRRLRERYPRATLLCLGDDAYRDPWAYRVCHGAYIRRTQPRATGEGDGTWAGRHAALLRAIRRDVAQLERARRASGDDDGGEPVPSRIDLGWMPLHQG